MGFDLHRCLQLRLVRLRFNGDRQISHSAFVETEQSHQSCRRRAAVREPRFTFDGLGRQNLALVHRKRVVLQQLDGERARPFPAPRRAFWRASL